MLYMQEIWAHEQRVSKEKSEGRRSGGGTGTRGPAAVGKRRRPRVIMWPSLAATKLPKTQAEPEYTDLHFVDVEIMDSGQMDWATTRGLLDSGSQGSCVNKALSTNTLTNHHEKRIPTTMIIVDGYDSPAGPITQCNPVKIRIAGHEEQLALDTASLSHPIIL